MHRGERLAPASSRGTPQVSVTTAQHWAGRQRTLGEVGMADHFSRPHSIPHRTPTRTERRLIKACLARRGGPAR
ncbi:hypothetical protein IQ279_27590 [Streptomyces verrucosisporus]|nr:hypothetical protein [Streptomyces verrucosisporus]